MQKVTIEDDGMIEINGRQVDIAIAAEHLSRAVRDANGDELAYHQCLKAALEAVGIEPMSHAANHRIAVTIWDAMDKFKKKDEVTPKQDEEHG